MSSPVREMLIASLLLIIPAGGAAAAETSLHIHSESGEPIGGGRDYFFTAADGRFFATAYAPNVVTLLFYGTNGTSWSLDFSAPSGQTLSVGTYRDARGRTFGDAPEPGLSISGNGLGCSDLEGSFALKEIALGPGNEVLSFRALFEQHCDGDAPALTGEIRFNSEAGLALRGPLERAVERTARLGYGFHVDGAGGEPVTITADGLPPGALMLVIPDGRGVISWKPPFEEHGFHEVTLRASTPSGSETVVTRIAVTGVTSLILEGDSLYPNADGPGLFLFPDEGDFDIRRNFDNGVSAAFVSPSQYWSIDFAAPADAPLEVGSYEGAGPFPFQQASQAGLRVSGGGQACTSTGGRFEVKQVEYAPDGRVRIFRAAFEHYCAGAAVPLRGEIRWLADVPLLVRAPALLPAFENQALGFNVRGFPARTTAPVLSAGELPQGAIFTDQGGGRGLLEWTPGFEQVGVHTLPFRVENGQGDTDRTATDVSVIPANDEIDAAPRATAVPFTAAGNNVTATIAPDDPRPSCGGLSSTVWYSFTPELSGRVYAGLTVGGLTLAAYSGARGALQELGCMVTGAGPGERLALDVTAGQTYYFMVSAGFGIGRPFAINLYPPLSVGIELGARGTVDPISGRAEVPATLTCSRPIDTAVRLELEQAARSGVRGEGSFLVSCPGEVSLLLGAYPIGGRFVPGPITAYVAVGAFDSDTREEAGAKLTQTILLRRFGLRRATSP